MQINVTDELEDFGANVRRIYSRLGGDLTPLMRQIGALAEGSTKERFNTKKDPNGVSWEQLAPDTVRQKGNANILIEYGDLFKSIQYLASSDETVIGTDRESGKYAQTGTINQPKRAYLGLSAEDRSGILRLVDDFYVDILNE